MSLVLILLLLANIISGYASEFKIGFMLRKGNVLDKRKLNLISDYTEKTFDPPNNLIKFYSCTYISNIHNISTFITDLDKENIKIIYSYCSDEYFDDNIRKLLQEKDILIWCINTYNIGSCEKHFVMGVGLIKIIEKCIYYINFYPYYSNIYHVNKSRRIWLYWFKQKSR